MFLIKKFEHLVEFKSISIWLAGRRHGGWWGTDLRSTNAWRGWHLGWRRHRTRLTESLWRSHYAWWWPLRRHWWSHAHAWTSKSGWSSHWWRWHHVWHLHSSSSRSLVVLLHSLSDLLWWQGRWRLSTHRHDVLPSQQDEPKRSLDFSLLLRLLLRL